VKLTEEKQIFLNKVDELVHELCANNFYSRSAREEMLKIFHLLLRDNDPEQTQKVRKLFRSISDYLTSYGKENAILTEKTKKSHLYKV
jgi:hypothetical protein